MDGILLAARILLVAAFAVAALAKLFDRAAARETLMTFGVPTAIASPGAVALPVAELAVAALLVPSGTAPVAALAALVLLALFTAAVVRMLARGEEAECHCFGRLSSRPVGAGTLIRNAALLALSALVAAGGAGTSATAWVGGLSALEAVLVGAVILLAGAVALNAAFLVQLFRQNGRLLARIEELDAGGSDDAVDVLRPGALVPSIVLPDLDGRPVDVDELIDPDDGLALLFSSPDCHACDPLLPEVGRLQRESAGGPC